jgi:murein DD-endopeptidase MepM/ murein hydrolase activator NlpD
LTLEPEYVKLYACSVNNRRANLLPKETRKREALTYSFLKFKSRFIPLSGGLRLKLFFPKATLVVIAIGFLLTLQPSLSFPPLKQTTIFAQEGISQSAQINSSTLPKIQLPHPGYLSTKFSGFHPGIDLAMGLGTPIRPIAEGTVEAVNYGFLGYGNSVLISHAGNLTSLYGHMARIYVTKNQVVGLDTIIGTIGLTGFTSGPHTHLEVTFEGKTIDPLTILPSIPDKPSVEYLTPFQPNQE